MPEELLKTWWNSVWPPDTVTRVVALSVVGTAVAVAALASLLFLLHCVDYAWRKEQRVAGFVMDMEWKRVPEEHSAFSDGGVITTEAHGVCIVTITSDDGWSKKIRLAEKDASRFKKGKSVLIYHQIGRLRGKRRICAIH